MRDTTIKDIAKEAKVSISTVSRVLNGNYPVSLEVKQRVEKAMKDLNYRPNAIARSLRNKKSNLIAFVIADLSNRFFMEAAKGLEIEISKAGYHLVIAGSDGDIKKEHTLIDALVERRIDGLVIATSDPKGEKVKYCLNHGIPVVLIDREVENLKTNQVLWNNMDGSYKLTKLLIDNGHKKIAIVNVTLNNLNGRQRLEGYKKALEEQGIPIKKGYISGSNFNKSEAYNYVKKIMLSDKPPTALFCANNIMLEGALQALNELNLKPYDDISIVSFGYLECNEYIPLKITSADQNSLEMGHKAGIILNNLLNEENRSSTQIILSPEIVIRDSVKKIT